MNRHQLPELPYSSDALEPHISKQTLDHHYGKHHASYVDNLNKLIEGSEFESATLAEIVRHADGEIFNNAAQVWNHNFYWQCLSPTGGGRPGGRFAQEIETEFGSLENFKESFAEAAGGNFGSGWTWLCKDSSGRLQIVNTDDAGNPMTDGSRPLLTCDVWEHAYYLDYQNRRDGYLDAFWKLVDWDFVAANAAP